MSSTPLSDKITALIETTSDSLVNKFQTEFLLSQVGLVMKGLPQHKSGERIRINDDSVTCTLVNDPENNSMIKVCADPDVFESTYKEGINALMTGKEAIEMLLKLPDIDGILICSASSFNSFPIYREHAKKLISTA